MGYRVEIVSNRKRLKDFLDLPYRVYANDPNWIAPMRSETKRILDTARNPYFKDVRLQLFNCYYSGQISARVAIVINPAHHKKYGGKTAFFGFFESLNYAEAIIVLFRAVSEYCKQNRITGLEGPFNPNHYNELGLLASHFDVPPVFFQPYNPPYYQSLLELAGFRIHKQVHTLCNTDIAGYIANQFPSIPVDAGGNYRLRTLRRNRLAEELENLRTVFNDAFEDNWQFLPLSKSEYVFSARYLDLVTPPDFIRFVEYDGVPVAALHCTLDINPLLKNFHGRFNLPAYLRLRKNIRKSDTLVIFAFGVKKAHRHSVALPLLIQACKKIAMNYRVMITTWTSDDNRAAKRVGDVFGLTRDRELVIMTKSISVHTGHEYVQSPPAGRVDGKQ